MQRLLHDPAKLISGQARKRLGDRLPDVVVAWCLVFVVVCGWVLLSVVLLGFLFLFGLVFLGFVVVVGTFGSVCNGEVTPWPVRLIAHEASEIKVAEVQEQLQTAVEPVHSFFGSNSMSFF